MHHSSFRQITRGLSQGRVLSPLLWLIHFNSIKAQLDHSRKQRHPASDGEAEVYCDLFDAHYVLLPMAHSRYEVLIAEAYAKRPAFEKAAAEKGLGTTREKSASMLPSPNETISGLYRRTPNGDQATAMDLKDRDAKISTITHPSSDDEKEDSALPAVYHCDSDQSTGDHYRPRNGIHIAHSEHYRKDPRKANILKRMGGSTWGAETGILRVTHKALIESAITYGFVAIDSCAHEKDLRRIDA